MPRGTPIQTNFNGGEWSPDMLGRVDLPKYRTALALGRNVIGSPRGPAERRPGFRTYGRVGDSARVHRLIPFVPSADAVYALEFGHQKLRIWRRDGSLVAAAPELVVNGTFAADLSSWTPKSDPGASIAWDPIGAMRLDGVAASSSFVTNGSFANQLSGWSGEGLTWLPSQRVRIVHSHFSLESGFARETHGRLRQTLSGLAIGATYMLRFQVVTTWKTNCAWSIAGASGTVGLGTHTRTFTATATTHVLEFRPASFPHDDDWYVEVDNISVSVQGATAAAEQALTVVPATAYVLTFRVVDGPITLRIGTTSGGQEILADTEYQVGQHQLIFEVPGTGTSTAFLGFRSPLPGRRLDDVSVRLETAAVVELATPYTEADLAQLDYAQSIDVAWFVDGVHQPRKLLRYADTKWALVPVTFRLPPVEEFGYAPPTALTPGAGATVYGTSGVTFTAGASTFLAADVGRDLVGVGVPGRAVIKTQAGATCTADILEPFESLTPLNPDQWRLAGSPLATCTPNVANVGQTGTLTLSAAGWRSADVGKFVRINGGLCEITAFTSATVVQMVVRSQLDGTTAAPADTWSLEEPRWSDARGWPSAIAIHAGRMFLAKDEDLDGSVIDDYENFRAGSFAKDAVRYRVNAGEFSRIQWLASLEDLIIGTAGPAHRLRAGENGLTPVDPPNVRRSSPLGAAKARPVVVDPYVLYIEDSGLKLVEMVFDFNVEAYQSEDAAILANHLPPPGLAEVVFQAKPSPVIWARRTDGQLLAVRHLPSQQVLGWFPQPLAGGAQLESLCMLPGPAKGYEQLWAIIRRTVAGAAIRTVEVLDFAQPVYLDGHVTYAGPPTSTVTGLEHLEGQTVQVIADSSERDDAVVEGGKVTISGAAASQIAVGLGYPWKVATLPVDGLSATGTSLGKPKRFTKFFLYLRDSDAVVVNGEPMRPVEDEDEALTGGDGRTFLAEFANLAGWGRAGQVVIEGDRPRPVTILALFGELVQGS